MGRVCPVRIFKWNYRVETDVLNVFFRIHVKFYTFKK